MADNVAITAGAGTTIATDEVNTGGGAAHVQLMKLLGGADGSTERIEGTAANGLEVDVTRLPALAAGTNNIGDVDVLSSALPTGASTEAKQDTIIGHLDGVETVLGTIDTDTGAIVGHVDGIEGLLTTIDADTGAIATSTDSTATNTGASATSLAILDDWDETDRCKVNPIVGQAGVAAGAGAVGATVQRVTLASDDPAVASLSVLDDWDNGASDGASVSGDVAHDTADAGEPVKLGHKAIDLGANPTDVAANDRTNWYSMRNGVPFVIGGAPFVRSQNLQVTDADGAQTDTAILTAAANVAIMVTAIEVTADNANTGDVSVRIGFGTANTPAADADKVIMFHPGIAPGSGLVKGSGAGIIGAGLSNEDLRVTCEDPAGGSISIVVTYFTLAIG